MTDCVLCRKPSTKSRIYKETEHLLIVHCKLCNQPMGIFKEHDLNIFKRKKLEIEMRDLFNIVSYQVYPYQHWMLDYDFRHSSEHKHWHIVPLGYWEGEEHRAIKNKDYGF